MPPAALTEADVASFEADGFLIVPDLLERDEVALLSAIGKWREPEVSRAAVTLLLAAAAAAHAPVPPES
jgi:hypothetical protein